MRRERHLLWESCTQLLDFHEPAAIGAGCRQPLVKLGKDVAYQEMVEACLEVLREDFPTVHYLATACFFVEVYAAGVYRHYPVANAST